MQVSDLKIRNNLYDRYRSLDVQKNIFDWAWKYHEDFINTLYHPNVYVFPLTPEGEELMNLFFKEEIISYRYGAYTMTNFCEVDHEVYNVVIENND
jgi:hypothetical protein